MNRFFLVLLLLMLPVKQHQSFILTPDLQGTINLSGGITAFIGFGTVLQPTRLTAAADGNDLILNFDLPNTALGMLFYIEDRVYFADTPGRIAPIQGDYLIYFDTVQLFAQSVENPHQVTGLGMIEQFSADLPLERQDVVAQIVEKQHILITEEGQRFLSAAHLPRYTNRFLGQDLGHPATFQFLGRARENDMPDIVRALLPTLPPGLPFGQLSSLHLWLPFDCSHDWVVSWGYHFSTQQNRYALDFASAEGAGLAQGLPIRAAHAGTVYLKRYGYEDGLVDLGYAARVVHEDGITSTQYGHLDESSLSFWGITDLAPFEWIEVGEVEAGEIIGMTGSSGYSLGAHIHFALWTYDQSLYRPSFDPGGELSRGMSFPAASRVDCERYE
ncbi:MAG: M23 family metallopeptidase [Anaerolineae bacterium]|nr:M23 family metallopeptidase [Anaerolineae bacterium]